MSDPRLASLRALVVEDNAFMRDLVLRLMRQIGFNQLREAVDGADALRTVMQFNPNLIVCDINMKPMNGIEFVTQLQRSGYTGVHKIPTIFLTSHAEEQYVQQARALGVDGFLVKPVNKQTLVARILAVLETAKPT
jgi:two-component system chemotaxis response regulator CheY